MVARKISKCARNGLLNELLTSLSATAFDRHVRRREILKLRIIAESMHIDKGVVTSTLHFSKDGTAMKRLRDCCCSFSWLQAGEQERKNLVPQEYDTRQLKDRVGQLEAELFTPTVYNLLVILNDHNLDG